MDMEVVFSGGLKVDAKFGDFVVKTDQPVKSGGENSAPAPYDLFLASLVTCAGIYVKFFCEKRNISLENIRVTQRLERDKDKKIVKIVQEIKVPKDFPEKYLSALEKSAGLCAVKKTILNPPEISIEAVIAD